MKVAKYNGIDGELFEVSYDEEAPCRCCGLPVVEASMGGTDVCPWCDCGYYRDGSKIEFKDLMDDERLRSRAKERSKN